MIVVIILALVVVIRYGVFHNRRSILDQALLPAVILGAIGFAGGFFLPIALAPTANQGPMLGIFITGPAGFLIGLVWGVWRAWRRGGSSVG
jgi:hypothetical protein